MLIGSKNSYYGSLFYYIYQTNPHQKNITTITLMMLEKG